MLLMMWFDRCKCLTDSSLPDIFFPFGSDEGDSVVSVGSRTCNGPISIPYKIFNYRTLYVSSTLCKSLAFLLLARYVSNVPKRSTWEQCIYWGPTTDRPTDLAFWKISNGHISATGHPIHFMFGSMVGFSRSADRVDLLPVGPNPRWRWLPSWKISNDHFSGMGYPIHFRELQSSFGGIQEKIMSEE